MLDMKYLFFFQSVPHISPYTFKTKFVKWDKTDKNWTKQHVTIVYGANMPFFCSVVRRRPCGVLNTPVGMYGSEFRPIQPSHPCYTHSLYLLNL